MKYRVYLVYQIAVGATVAARNVLRSLTGTTLENFQPLQERLVGEIELEKPLELDEEEVRNLLRTRAPNASGMRLEPVVEVLAPEEVRDDRMENLLNYVERLMEDNQH
jgi:hypothetical protein